MTQTFAPTLGVCVEDACEGYAVVAAVRSIERFDVVRPEQSEGAHRIIFSHPSDRENPL
jgi:hypothetical protein